MRTRTLAWKSVDPTAALRLVALVGLTLMASIFFRPVFGTWSFFVPPVVGAVVACLVVALVCDRFNLDNGFGAFAQLVTFCLVAPALINLSEAKFGLPLPSAWTALFRAAIEGPSRLLTSPIPARSEQELLIVPILGGWLGLTVGWLLARRGRAALALLGPALALIVALAFGPLEQSTLKAATFGFCVGAFAYFVLIDRLGGRRSVEHQSTVTQIRAFVPAGIVIAAVTGLAIAISSAVPFGRSQERFSLRAYRTPPFDVQALSSPLADYRKFLTPAYKNKVLFETSGEQPGNWRLATLSAYDGRVWSVGQGSVSEGQFELLGAKMDPRGARFVSGKTHKTTVRVLALDEPFLPLAGKGVEIDLPTSVRSRLRHNPISDVLVWADGTPIRVNYDLRWKSVGSMNASSVTSESFDNSEIVGGLEGLPEQIRQFALETTEGATSDGQRAALLQKRLREGFYSLNARPGHSYGATNAFLADPTRMVGNEEQYTAAFATLARSLQIPVRVVVGFEPVKSSSKSVEVRGADIRTWAEVKYTGPGWVRYDVTPPKSRSPKPRAAENDDRVDAPPPNFDPLPQPLDQQEGQAAPPKKSAEKKLAKRFEVPVVVKVGASIVGVPMIAGASLLAGLSLLKSRRRKRRRGQRSPNGQIAGAWDEVLDRLQESRRGLPSSATFSEAVSLLDRDDPERPLLADIAARAERAVFAAEAPTESHSTEIWTLVDQFRSAIRGRKSRLERLRLTAQLGPLSAQRSPRNLRSLT